MDIAPSAMIREFLAVPSTDSLPISSPLNASQEILPGKRVGGFLKTSISDFNELEKIQYMGNNNISDAIIAIINSITWYLL
jgi:hypothetical protein